MTHEEFWDAYARFQAGCLSPAECSQFQTIGVFAEYQARERGTTLIPYAWQRDTPVPVHQLSADHLIAIGMTVLALSGCEGER